MKPAHSGAATPHDAADYQHALQQRSTGRATVGAAPRCIGMSERDTASRYDKRVKPHCPEITPVDSSNTKDTASHDIVSLWAKPPATLSVPASRAPHPSTITQPGARRLASGSVCTAAAAIPVARMRGRSVGTLGDVRGGRGVAPVAVGHAITAAGLDAHARGVGGPGGPAAGKAVAVKGWNR